MSKLGRTSRARRRSIADDEEALALSIAQFCRLHNISTSFFHKLRTKGLAPAIMRVGARTLISVESARAWRKQNEQATSST
jgi:hypothetical protein